MAKFPEMDRSAKDLTETFTLFREHLELFLQDGGVTEGPKQATKIKLALGNQGLWRLNTSGMSEEEKKDPLKIWKLFSDQLTMKVNFRIHRLELLKYHQRSDENLDQFVSRCREKAAKCDFSAEELAEHIIELVICSIPTEAF